MQKKVLCILGPTASGKTQLAFDLYDYYSKVCGCDLISCDSALIYKHMNIGTAKPIDSELKKYPHKLIDIRQPEQVYSVGDFYRDANLEINKTLESNKLPILVGGTMMYYNSLLNGLSDLPSKDDSIRAKIQADANTSGWDVLHKKLLAIDPRAAAKINQNDTQRITRALEVYQLTGKGISYFWEQGLNNRSANNIEYILIGLDLERKLLHSRIQQRFEQMLADNFLDEVHNLMHRPGLTANHPSMKSVGYRQAWEYLVNDTQDKDNFNKFKEGVLVATRQLAKHQCTWMRSFVKNNSNINIKIFDVSSGVPIDEIKNYIQPVNESDIINFI